MLVFLVLGTTLLGEGNQIPLYDNWIGRRFSQDVVAVNMLSLSPWRGEAFYCIPTGHRNWQVKPTGSIFWGVTSIKPNKSLGFYFNCKNRAISRNTDAFTGNSSPVLAGISVDSLLRKNYKFLSMRVRGGSVGCPYLQRGEKYHP